MEDGRCLASRTLRFRPGRFFVACEAAGSGFLIADQRTAGLVDADADEPLVGSWVVAATPPRGLGRTLASFVRWTIDPSAGL
jgi:hypothetical protein